MKNITITLNEISAQIVADTLEFYNLYMLEEAEKRGSIYLISPEFSRAILEGCYMLAYNDHSKDIIKAYL